jgi:hypothetical protein
MITENPDASTLYQHIVQYVDWGVENIYKMQNRDLLHDFIVNTTGQFVLTIALHLTLWLIHSLILKVCS